MMRSANEGWLPITGLPAGLISWFAAAGPMTMLASWLAVIDGYPPELRAGWSGRWPGGQALPADVDFTVSIPADPGPPALRQLIAKAVAGSPVAIDDGAAFVPARSVHAPLLAGCVLQIECVHGSLAPDGWDAELAGEILLLHRGGLFLAPATSPDFLALQPLSSRFPS